MYPASSAAHTLSHYQPPRAFVLPSSSPPPPFPFLPIPLITPPALGDRELAQRVRVLRHLLQGAKLASACPRLPPHPRSFLLHFSFLQPPSFCATSLPYSRTLPPCPFPVRAQGVRLLQAGSAPKAVARSGTTVAPAYGPIVTEAMATGVGNYFANLALYPGRFEFFEYFPDNLQARGEIPEPGKQESGNADAHVGGHLQ